ncbi:hypothetical protein FSP39_018639 [Pinctada imbricata]|uniref:Death domain-containing protein n=1 Tax=Pinctada imbricata TaxID=66713 RepID=A0AA88Y4J4_PINIB|nr:hypothetical protein FSP39_018639 [Pinctada imbricata]
MEGVGREDEDDFSSMSFYFFILEFEKLKFRKNLPSINLFAFVLVTKGEVALHNAAKQNDIDSVTRLLSERRVDINCKNNLDRTALHWASANGNLPIIEKLLECGADIEAKDKYGMRPVLWAAWFGHLEALKILINTGATPSCTNKQGMGILHCASQNNHISIMNFIVESLETINVNDVEQMERTALHLAAEAGHLEAVMRLIDMRCDANKRDKAGETAMHLAAKSGRSEIIKKLLILGVVVDDRDGEGQTALHLAGREGHLTTVQVLLDFNAGANSETIKEMCPLHFAVAQGHEDIVMELIKNGANLDSQNFQGNTPLHMASLANLKNIAKLLIDAKCQIDVSNHRQQTPLHVAVEAGHDDMVEILLGAGADLLLREKLGKTPLQLAARGSFITIVDMIIKAQRYYAVTRDYHDKELDTADPHQYLQNPQHPLAVKLQDTLQKLATKHLKSSDWKKLAVHWKFTPEHIHSIEHQYTGNHSYKEHGFRLMMIWLHGVRKDENVMKLLYEALVAIDRRQLAEQTRRKVELQGDKFCMETLCSIG